MEETSPKKILIAEDEQPVRLVLKRTLSQNYIILEAGDGEAAVDIARRENPDIILMDVLMPKVDGYTACHAIKKDPATRMIPVAVARPRSWNRGSAVIPDEPPDTLRRPLYLPATAA